MTFLQAFDLKEITSVTLILFAIIDVVGTVPVIIELKRKAGRIDAERASLAVLLLMVVFLFLGNQLLSIIGLDIASFAIAGSLVIFFIALEMILGHKFFKEEASTDEITSVSIVPLAFPLIAGAGTMTTLLSLKSQYHTENIITGIVFNTLFVYLVLKNTHHVERLLGKTGLEVLRKAFGIILLAIAIKLFRSNTGL
ncbi:MarC family protein [Mucilaginibacter sp. HMF5004]|uniref:MarC family protein n=1 Tax=Mucilaginibacter rivuli TaxID=2857527 RepID=UPI001C605D4E|nr:MarC family protein [Mucilaginibacter rivuli]MBW4890607.1 MarC family protein [Mucilaginibacter rivuli]